MAPAQDILGIIAQKGAVTVAEYMALALMHPEFGYYMKKDPLGAAGDFTTAPEISQTFGELIGAWLASQWQEMRKPQCVLAELGPGRGTLMGDILRATKRVPGFHAAASIHLVERSPALRQKQWQALSGKHPRIEWHAGFSEIPQKPLLLVANEFFDALPVRQFVYEDGWKERTIFLPLEGGGLATAKPSLRWGSQPVRQDGLPPFPSPSRGRIYEYSPAAETIAREIGAHIETHGGAALIVDYGYEKNTGGDTLQAVKAHRYHDVLSEPGTADLTCHVDFALLKEAAESAGAAVYGPALQGMFLHALGMVLRTAQLCQGASEAQKAALLSSAERLVSLEKMGGLFKVLAIAGKNQRAPEGF